MYTEVVRVILQRGCTHVFVRSHKVHKSAVGNQKTRSFTVGLLIGILEGESASIVEAVVSGGSKGEVLTGRQFGKGI